MDAEIRFTACEPPLHVRFCMPPRALLVAECPGEVRHVLDAAHAQALAGRWCVGFVRYEAAPAFDAAFEVHAADGPLAWFAVFDAPDASPPPVASDGPVRIDWNEGPSRADFNAAIAEIHRAIADGEVYQVN